MGKKLTPEEYVAEVAIKNPNVEVLEDYQGINKKIWHRYKNCGHERQVTPSTILQGCGCYQCMIGGRLPVLEDVMASQKFLNSNWEIDGEYYGHRTPTWLRCKKCGYKKLVAPRDKSLKAPCPECEGRKRISFKINDLKTARPEIAAMMEDQELAGKVGVGSKIDAWFICPFCGTRVLNKPANVCRCGLCCPACSGGRKYPNRFMFNVLKNILNKFESEYTRPWTDGRKYDFMFELDSKKYLIEMDGGQHKNGFGNIESKAEIQKNDRHKDALAEKHEFNLIRIDCDYQNKDRFQYIKQNILQSELVAILDFSNVDWIQADLISQPSDFQKICMLYDTETHDVEKIAHQVGVCTATVIQHLIHSEEIGCSSYKHKDGLIERNELRKQKISSSNGAYLLCLETNEIFPSIATAKRYYGGRIDQYLAGKADHAGILPDGRQAHYKRIQKFEVDDFVNSGNYVLMHVDFDRDNQEKYKRSLKNVIKCNETGEYFINIQLANKMYHTSVGHYFDGSNTYAGKLDDGTLLTWARTTINEVIKFIDNGGIIIS